MQFRSDFYYPTINYCEHNITGLIAQPANSWSNLAYVLIGLYLILNIKKSSSKLLYIFPLFPILIGICSFIYHASYSFWGQFLDLTSMFLFSSYLIILNLSRLKFNLRKLFFIYFLINLVSLGWLYFHPTMFSFNSGIIIFSLHIFSLFLLEYYIYKKMHNYSLRPAMRALIIMAVAFMFWIFDLSRLWCHPISFHYINGHALWHIINSFVFIYLYKFYQQFKFGI